MIIISFIFCICLENNIFAMVPLNDCYSQGKHDRPVLHPLQLPRGKIKAFKPISKSTQRKKQAAQLTLPLQTNDRTLSPQNPIGHDLFVQSKTHHYSSSGNLIKKDSRLKCSADSENSSDEDELSLNQPLSHNASMPSALHLNDFASTRNLKDSVSNARTWLQQCKDNECRDGEYEDIFKNNNLLFLNGNLYFIPTLSTIYEI